MTRWGVHIKNFCILKFSGCFENKYMYGYFHVKLKYPLFFTEHHFYLKEQHIMVIQTYIFGINFPQNELSESLQGKQLTVFIANDKI